MKKIRLNIYIGKVAKNLIEENDFAYVDVRGVYIPNGYSGSANNAKIHNLSNLKNYICDWYDLFKDFDQNIDNLSADIMLNTQTNHKIFRGKEIINFIDKLSQKSLEQIWQMRNFDI